MWTRRAHDVESHTGAAVPLGAAPAPAPRSAGLRGSVKTCATGRRGAVRFAVGVVLLGWLPIVLILVPVGASAVVSVDPAAELEFVADEHFVSPKLRFFDSATLPKGYHLDHNVGGHAFFDQVEVARRSDDDSALIFAVDEQPDASLYEYCPSWPACHAVSVGVDAGTGLMFLWSESRRDSRYHNDFPSQRVVLSVQEDGGARKVYREVMVHRSELTPDCSDYPEQNKQRYTCLFLNEYLPPNPPVMTGSMREALPDVLVQPKENYSLVFAEEFNGTQAVNSSGNCRNRMNTLNQDYFAWSFGTNPCLRVDREGTPCNDIENGHYYMSQATPCNAELITRGLFRYKYGYMEVKYTVNYESWGSYLNHAMSLGDPGLNIWTKPAKFGIEQDSYESILSTVGGVVTPFEYISGNRHIITQSWVQPWGRHKLLSAPPTRSRMNVRYCRNFTDSLRITLRRFCGQDSDTVTMTQGLEWTPAGYRFLLKVDDVYDRFDDFALFPESLISVSRKEASMGSDGVTFASDWEDYSETDEHGLFTHLTAGDDDSLLVKVGVSHVPMGLGFAAWGYPLSTHDFIKTKLAVDYIRVYQPADGYLDMEPTFH